MKFLPLIWAALLRKPLRTTLTTLALVAAFVLFGLLQSINAGFTALRDNARWDKLFVASRFGTPLPIAYKQQIAQMPGVKTVIASAGIGGTINGDPKRPAFVSAAEPGAFAFHSQYNAKPAQVAELQSKRNAFIISQANASLWGLKVGDRIILNGMPRKDGGKDWEFDLVGIVDVAALPGVGQLSIGNFDYINEDRAQGRDMVGQFMVLMNANDRDIATATAKAIDDRFLNSSAPARTTIEALTFEQITADNTLRKMVNAIVFSTLFALLLTTSNSLMQSFRERIPEFGTLKAIGFGDHQVLGLVVAEALIQCTIGALIGLAIAKALTPTVKRLLAGQGTEVMTLSWPLFGLGLLTACLVALISAAVPAWRAGRMQIVNALAVK